MNLEEKNLLPQNIDDPTWGEAFLSFCVNAMVISSGEPVAIFAHFLNQAATSVARKRLHNVIHQVRNRLKCTDSPVDIVKSEEFLDITRIAFLKISQQHSEEKRLYLQNIYLKYIDKIIIDGERDFNKSELYLNIASSIMPATLISLGILKKILNKNSIGLLSERYFNEFFKNAKKASGIYLNNVLLEMVNFGLIYDMSNGAFRSDEAFKITPVGYDFLDWIISPSDTEEQATS